MTALEGGQGVIFILDGSAAATHAAEGAGEISLAKIDEFAGEYWNDTSWAGDGWLPSNEDILNDNGHLSTVSKYEVDKQGGTLILDSFGDTDLAFDVDHYIGSEKLIFSLVLLEMIVLMLPLELVTTCLVELE